MVTVYETLERPLVPVLAEMERIGVKVDAEQLRALTHRLHQAHGRDRGGDPQARRPRVQRRLAQAARRGAVRRDGARRRPQGQDRAPMSTDADVLEDLAAQGHDLPARVLDWRQLQKLKSTYTDALIAQIDPDTGRVHTSYAMAVAATGRLSSTDPTCRTSRSAPRRAGKHPPRLRRRRRRVFLSRPTIRRSSCACSPMSPTSRALKEAFREGADIHAMTASEVFGMPVEGMDADGARPRQGDQFRHHLRHLAVRARAPARASRRARRRS